MSEKAISECMSHSTKRQGIRGRLSFGIDLGEHRSAYICFWNSVFRANEVIYLLIDLFIHFSTSLQGGASSRNNPRLCHRQLVFQCFYRLATSNSYGSIRQWHNAALTIPSNQPIPLMISFFRRPESSDRSSPVPWCESDLLSTDNSHCATSV